MDERDFPAAYRMIASRQHFIELYLFAFAANAVGDELNNFLSIVDGTLEELLSKHKLTLKHLGLHFPEYTSHRLPNPNDRYDVAKAVAGCLNLQSVSVDLHPITPLDPNQQEFWGWMQYYRLPRLNSHSLRTIYIDFLDYPYIDNHPTGDDGDEEIGRIPTTPYGSPIEVLVQNFNIPPKRDKTCKQPVYEIPTLEWVVFLSFRGVERVWRVSWSSCDPQDPAAGFVFWPTAHEIEDVSLNNLKYNWQFDVDEGLVHARNRSTGCFRGHYPL
ncbi:hypothetical protein ABW19_dt0202918 [Dactylella cylindrospora]|nr:hypothetical protein ABW19_dt0202918 [Dactylella cylindrospora]